MIIPAEVFPLCYFIQEELEARGWSHADLISDGLMENRAMDLTANPDFVLTASEAKALADTLEVSEKFLLATQARYNNRSR